MRMFQHGDAILELADARVHLRLEMREAARELRLQHELQLGARVGNPPLDVVEAPSLILPQPAQWISRSLRPSRSAVNLAAERRPAASLRLRRRGEEPGMPFGVV